MAARPSRTAAQEVSFHNPIALKRDLIRMEASEYAMGELCLRWAMKLPANTPINWPPYATPAMDRIRAALLAMDDMRDLPRLSNNHLARHTGLSETAVRKALARMARAGAGGAARAG
jgi:hypothetical protein